MHKSRCSDVEVTKLLNGKQVTRQCLQRGGGGGVLQQTSTITRPINWATTEVDGERNRNRNRVREGQRGTRWRAAAAAAAEDQFLCK